MSGEELRLTSTWRRSSPSASAAASSSSRARSTAASQGAWDYGPLGVEMANNIKRAWWRAMVQERDDVVGIDAAILMHPDVWRASGHVETFTDPMVDCRNCQGRFRADELDSDVCPNCGAKGAVHRAAHVQPDAAHVPGACAGRRGDRVPATGDGAGHLRELRERAEHDATQAAVRRRADRQVVPQRDHAAQLHLPRRASSSRWRWSTSAIRRTRVRLHDEWIEQRRALVPALRHEAGEPARCARTRRRSCRTTRRRHPTSSISSRSAGRSSRAWRTAATTT